MYFLKTDTTNDTINFATNFPVCISQVIIVSMTQPYYNALQLSIEHSATRIVMKLTSDLEFNCNNLPVLVNI